MFVLYQVANACGRLQSADGSTYVKALGFFEKKESALRYASKYNVEIRIAPLKAWTILLNKKDADQPSEEDHYKKLLAAYEAEETASLERVQEAVKLKKTGDLTMPLPLLRNEVHGQEHGQEAQDMGEIPVPAGQNVCLVAILPDLFHEEQTRKLQESRRTLAKKEFVSSKNGIYRSSGEILEEGPFYEEWATNHPSYEIPGDQPLLMFLGVYETEGKAKADLEKFSEFNVPKACLSMGRFVRLRDIKTVKTERSYADPKLQTLMNALQKAQEEAS